VMADNSNRRISEVKDEPKAKPAKRKAATKKKAASASTKKIVIKEGDVCPECGKGHIIKGKTAYGCSMWKEGCTFRAPIEGQ